MTPLHIKLAMHYLCIAEPYAERNPQRANAPAVIEYTLELVEAGLIVPDSSSPSGYRATPGLRMYVEALKAVPLPKQVTQWTMNTKEHELRCRSGDNVQRVSDLSFLLRRKSETSNPPKIEGIITERGAAIGRCVREGGCTCTPSNDIVEVRLCTHFKPDDPESNAIIARTRWAQQMRDGM